MWWSPGKRCAVNASDAVSRQPTGIYVVSTRVRDFMNGGSRQLAKEKRDHRSGSCSRDFTYPGATVTQWEQ